MAGIRGKAAARLGPFMGRVRGLPRAAGVLYADETPARADGKLAYMPSRAPSSSPRCTPAGGLLTTSTPAVSFPVT